MANSKDLLALKETAEFQELVTERHRLVTVLGLIVSIDFAAYVLSMAFASDFLATTPMSGSPITIGLLWNLLIILVGIGTAGYYTWWSNTTGEKLKKAVLDKWDAQ